MEEQPCTTMADAPDTHSLEEGGPVAVGVGESAMTSAHTEDSHPEPTHESLGHFVPSVTSSQPSPPAAAVHYGGGYTTVPVVTGGDVPDPHTLRRRKQTPLSDGQAHHVPDTNKQTDNRWRRWLSMLFPAFVWSTLTVWFSRCCIHWERARVAIPPIVQFLSGHGDVHLAELHPWFQATYRHYKHRGGKQQAIRVCQGVAILAALFVLYTVLAVIWTMVVGSSAGNLDVVTLVNTHRFDTPRLSVLRFQSPVDVHRAHVFHCDCMPLSSGRGVPPVTSRRPNGKDTDGAGEHIAPSLVLHRREYIPLFPETRHADHQDEGGSFVSSWWASDTTAAASAEVDARNGWETDSAPPDAFVHLGHVFHIQEQLMTRPGRDGHRLSEIFLSPKMWNVSGSDADDLFIRRHREFNPCVLSVHMAGGGIVHMVNPQVLEFGADDPPDHVAEYVKVGMVPTMFEPFMDLEDEADGWADEDLDLLEAYHAAPKDQLWASLRAKVHIRYLDWPHLRPRFISFDKHSADPKMRFRIQFAIMAMENGFRNLLMDQPPFQRLEAYNTALRKRDIRHNKQLTATADAVSGGFTDASNDPSDHDEHDLYVEVEMVMERVDGELQLVPKRRTVTKSDS